MTKLIHQHPKLNIITVCVSLPFALQSCCLMRRQRGWMMSSFWCNSFTPPCASKNTSSAKSGSWLGDSRTSTLNSARWRRSKFVIMHHNLVFKTVSKGYSKWSSSPLCIGEGGVKQEGREAYYLGAVGGHGLHGHPVWHLGQAHLVGVLLGHHGARHLLHHLWHGDGHVRLLCTNTPGKT